MAKFKLVKVQTPVKHTNELLTQISDYELYEQIIVDPQSPKEQARIQSFKDDLEDYGSRLIHLSSILNIPLEELPSLKEEDKTQINNPEAVAQNLKAFLDKNEEVVTSKFNELKKLEKENRILSALTSFQDEMDKEEFSIDLLSSSSSTFTILGEIPSSYEEFIVFYLHEVTAGKIFFWSSPTEEADRKAAIVISLEEFRENINEILKENYFDKTKFDFDVLKSIEEMRETTKITDLRSEVVNDINKIEAELENLSIEMKEVIRNKLMIITKTHSILTNEEKGRTDSKNFTIWGWVESKDYTVFTQHLSELEFQYDVNVLEDVPLSRKKKMDVEQEIFSIKVFDLVEKEVSTHIPQPPHAGGGEGFLFAKKALFVKLQSKERDTRNLVSYIHSLNSIHPIKIGSLDNNTIEKVKNQTVELTQYQTRISKLKDILKPENTKGIDFNKFQITDEYSHSKAFIENFFRDYEEKVLKVSEDYEDLRRKRDQIELSLPFEEGLKEKGIDAVLLKSGFQTVTYLGSVPKNHFKSVKFFLNEVTDGNLVLWDSEPSDSNSNQKNILVLSLKEYENTVSRVLNEYSFQEIEIDMTVVERKVSLKDVLKETEKELENKAAEVEKIKEELTDKLLATDELISIELLRLKTVEQCQISEGTVVFWGWISKQKLKTIEKEKDSLPFELEVTTNPEVPLVNPAITKRGKVFGAVRGIVGGIGQPGPKEVDPYSIMRFTFPFLFGLMFADVGHGILLSLIAAFFVINKKRKNIKPDESMTGYIYSGAELLLFCGLSATVFGFLFGSLLGDEHFLAELYHSAGIDWLPLIQPLLETKLFLIVALSIGFLMIQLGILLKVYQNLRYGHGVASWGAPLSLSVVYVGVFTMLFNIIVGDGIVWHALHITVTKLPAFFVYFLGALPVLFVLEYMHAKSEGIMDAVDHIIALISNTLSFSRLMALLLVHGILSALPFTLTGVDLLATMPTFTGSVATLLHPIFSSELGASLTHAHYLSALGISWIWWIVGIVLALVIIIPLEGLLSFLNTLRLHWVEWFTKFYVGDGKEYLPITEQLNFINYVTAKGS
ncbi:MAG: V-type ATPase 116kDa subunit family protein [Candidatus Heimdallarchaeaceae archaeon]